MTKPYETSGLYVTGPLLLPGEVKPVRTTFMLMQSDWESGFWLTLSMQRDSPAGASAMAITPKLEAAGWEVSDEEGFEVSYDLDEELMMSDDITLEILGAMVNEVAENAIQAIGVWLEDADTF